MKDFYILHSIRRSTGFSRGVAFLVIVAIVAIMAERTIYYVLEDNDIIEAENQVERIQQMAPHMAKRLGLGKASQKPAPPSVEANFSQTAQGLKETLSKASNRLNDENFISETNEYLETIHHQFQSMDKEIMAKFDDTQKLITEKKLSDVIQARQDQAVSHYKKNYRKLITLIEQVNQANTQEEKKKNLLALDDMLKKQKFKRDQQPFDPNNLPNKNLQPDPDNKPKTSVNEFKQAGLYSTPLNQVAALGDFTYDSLPGATNPAYLAETDEVTISQAIKDHAASLNYDPVKIYHWVRNNVEWQPAWGAVQNADLTLLAKRGNAMDIASLTIALLRASRIPSRYVHGTIDVPKDKYLNWTGGFTDINAAANYAASAGIPTTTIVSGGQIKKIRMEHIWVEAAIDYHPSRGAKNFDADSWVQMDPSYKQYDFKQGLDVIQISGIDPEQLANNFANSGTVNEAEGWVTGFDPAILQDAQQQAQSAIENYINTNLPNANVGDVIGGRQTIIKEYPTLPSSLPNDIVVTGSRYNKLASQLQQHITFALGKDILGDLINPSTFSWSKLNNEKVTLSFKPATPEDEAALLSLLPEGEITDLSQLPGSIPSYLVDVIPELKVNGTTVMTGNSMRLGEELDFVTYIDFANRLDLPARNYKVIAGSYLSVNVFAGNISKQKIYDVKMKLAETEGVLESGDSAQISDVDRDDVIGDMYYLGSLIYYSYYSNLSRIASSANNGQVYLSAGRGTIGYEPKVKYFFGFPQTISFGGISFDIPIVSVTGVYNGDLTKKKNLVSQNGVLSSALESLTPEQIYTTNFSNQPDAISAVKALAKANASGQRIYHITSSNSVAILPLISHDASVVNEIKSALVIGKEVLTHTNSVTVPGWIGAGYIIQDPVTGDAAYKISGGTNGGYSGQNNDFSLLDLLIPTAAAGTSDQVSKGINRANLYMSAYDAIDSCDTWQSRWNYFYVTALLGALITSPFVFLFGLNIFVAIFTVIFASILMSYLRPTIIANNPDCR